MDNLFRNSFAQILGNGKTESEIAAMIFWPPCLFSVCISQDFDPEYHEFLEPRCSNSRL